MSDEKKNKGKKAVEDTQDDRAIKAAGLLELFELANGINFMIHHGEPAPELAPVAEPATPAKPAEKRKYKRSATRIPPEAEGIQVKLLQESNVRQLWRTSHGGTPDQVNGRATWRRLHHLWS